MGKKKRKFSKSKVRIFISLLIFGSITTMLGYNCLNNILQIIQIGDLDTPSREYDIKTNLK